MAKSTKVQSTKVRNLVVSIPCILQVSFHIICLYQIYFFEGKTTKMYSIPLFWSNLSACEVNVNTIIYEESLHISDKYITFAISKTKNQ